MLYLENRVSNVVSKSGIKANEIKLYFWIYTSERACYFNKAISQELTRFTNLQILFFQLQYSLFICRFSLALIPLFDAAFDTLFSKIQHSGKSKLIFLNLYERTRYKFCFSNYNIPTLIWIPPALIPVFCVAAAKTLRNAQPCIATNNSSE